MISRYNELVIATPEGVQFVHRLASPVARFLALVIDLAVITVVMTLLSVVSALLDWISADIAVAFSILLYFIVSLGYFILLELAWRGQTLGKRLLRLRVIDANGLKLKPNQLVLRTLMRFVDSLPFFYFLGGACALLSSRSQRLGDLAAGTVVVRMPEHVAPTIASLGEKAYNSFRDHPRLEALLRQRVPPEPAMVALQALRRREEMDPVERAKLYRKLAAYFREQVTFPEESTSTMSDEQYLLNCVDTLLRMAK